MIEKVLVVDLDRQILKMVSFMLGSEGYEVITSSRPKEALEFFASQKPSIVMLDYRLPGMDDMSLITDFINSDVNANVVVMSSYSSETLVVEMRRMGVSDCLTKPFLKDDLLYCIKSTIYAREAFLSEKEQLKVLLASGRSKDLAALEEELGTIEGVIETCPLKKAFSHIATSPVDIVVMDVTDTFVDIIELLRKISIESPLTDIVVLSDVEDFGFFRDVVREGAYDCIAKPYNKGDVRKVLVSLMERRKSSALRNLKQRYERELVRGREQLEYVLSVVESMIFALEARDRYTRGHSERVTAYALEVATAMGFDEAFLNRLNHASRLHDIGKIGIDDAILRKPGRLTDDEFNIMRDHPKVGENILKPVKILSGVLQVIRHHHERYDGKGYPDGLKGEDIPPESRIIAVVDSYDAMRSNRPYRDKLELAPVLEEIEREAGSQFDPQVVDVFLRLVREKEDFEEVLSA